MFTDGQKVYHNTFGTCYVDGNSYEAVDGSMKVFIKSADGALHCVSAIDCKPLDAKTAVEKLNGIKTLADLLIAKIESGEFDGTSELYAALFDGADALEPFFLG